MIEWNDGLNIGVKVLDDDHKKLLGFINRLSKAIDDNLLSGELQEIFTELEEYVLKHFQMEETLLKKCNYKNFDEHHKQHQMFADKIQELKENFFTSNSYFEAKEMSAFLIDWLINHIISEDMQLIESFEHCGLTDKKEISDSWFNALKKRIIDKITLRKMIFVVTFIPLIGMLIFSSIIIFNYYYKYKEVKTVSEITYSIFDLNELSHLLQIERGLSSANTSSNSNKFTDDLHKQRQVVDSSIKTYIRHLNNIDSENTQNTHLIQRLNEDIASLNHIRKAIDDKTISEGDEIDFYTNIIQNILLITSKIIFMNTNKDIVYSLSTLSSLLNMKEIMGEERALGMMIIERQNSSDNKEYKKFIEKFGAQKIYYNLFTQTSTEHDKKIIDNLLNTPLAQKISDYKINILNKDYNNLDSKVWFELNTEHINMIKKVIDNHLEKTQELIHSNLDMTILHLQIWCIFLFLMLSMTALIINLFKAVISKQISSLTAGMKNLAFGGRNLKFSRSNSKDEISQIYNAYEIMRQKLLKSDIIAQLYQTQEKIKFDYIKELNLKLEQEVIHDGLTGLFNRRYYDEIIEKELMRAKRDKLNFTFVMLDIDFFKLYNDTYGHQEGDKALKAVAKLLQEMLSRGGDFCFRLGGEEFGFFFTGASFQESLHYTEEICQEIEKLQIPHSKNKASKYITASLGFVHVNMSTYVIDEHAIYVAADEALYKAKEEGRNRVAIYETSEMEIFN